ncbi:MAG: hypothetical protein L0Z50_42445, partial [Verrucomicrobiales bacterium]|nr:hypothetical protein [Verrucomicrobiales bacterium]
CGLMCYGGDSTSVESAMPTATDVGARVLALVTSRKKRIGARSRLRCCNLARCQKAAKPSKPTAAAALRARSLATEQHEPKGLARL